MLQQEIRVKCICAMFILTIAFLFNGCASITRGTEDTLVIESEPSGASVKLSNGMTGRTPTSFRLPRKDDVFVTISKDGFETINMNISSQISSNGRIAMIGNILLSFGCIIGGAIDASNGAMRDLIPNSVRVVLNPLDPKAKLEQEELAAKQKKEELETNQTEEQRSAVEQRLAIEKVLPGKWMLDDGSLLMYNSDGTFQEQSKKGKISNGTWHVRIGGYLAHMDGPRTKKVFAIQINSNDSLQLRDNFKTYVAYRQQ